ncbi:MAG: NAD(+) synthase [Clostridia bacterium]|nr:NAD(+) synthase [Clostridia bacterium]
MERKIKIALASPTIRLCDPEYNVSLLLNAALEAAGCGSQIIAFPELALTGATAGDLYFQEALTDAAASALTSYIDGTRDLGITSFLGLPISDGGKIYNAVVCVRSGKILGATAKGGGEESFFSLPTGVHKMSLGGLEFEISRDSVYTHEPTRAEIFVKIGDDDASCTGGVDLILNPRATAEYVGLSESRRSFAENLSYQLDISFAAVGAGIGESGTDGIYSGARIVATKGRTVAVSDPFDEKILYAELLLDSMREEPELEAGDAVMRMPFVPEDEEECRRACELAIELQARALALRMERAYAKSLVLGVSGGLDSTLAILVSARAVDILGLERTRVIAITMPCFGTTERTKTNALALAEELGCTLRTIDIKAAVTQHFTDISHDPESYDVVYENAQARERTQILMDVANAEGGMVVGTGDLSELALGFATYNGDHMSMYAVNASVPKTLMRAIILNEATRAASLGKDKLAHILTDVVNTPVSPELLPTENGENKQHTETIIGPYELHDFFLYYTVKYGYSPKRIYELAREAFREYSGADISRYLSVFVRRFFSSQFKRSCMPDGPRVTEISLSPRASWHMPSDVSSAVWQRLIPCEDN